MAPAKPKSDGRAVSRFNALTHGLTSAAPVIPGVESAEEWEAHREAVLADLEPAGAVQSALAERIAGLAWRLRRVDRYECESIAVSRERVDYDFAMQQSRMDQPVTVREAELAADDARTCLDLLEHLRDTPPETPLAEADVRTLFDALAGWAGEEADEYLEGIAEAADEGDWTAGRLVSVLKAVAARDGDGFAELFADVVARARALATGAQLDVARMGEELERIRRERLFPDAPTLDRIVRYETALNRMLYQALSSSKPCKTAAAASPLRCTACKPTASPEDEWWPSLRSRRRLAQATGRCEISEIPTGRRLWFPKHRNYETDPGSASDRTT